jgi:SagB-type dehydrogenase family enzyme
MKKLFDTMNLKKFEKISLFKPEINKGLPVMKAIANRHTSYNFIKDKPLSLQQISDILYISYGQSHGHNKIFKTVPSALKIYPLIFFVVFTNGIYKYEPFTHELIPYLKGDYTDNIGIQPFAKNAFMNILIYADLEKKIEGSDSNEYDDRDLRMKLACLDVGHCTENVYLYCEGEGLKCCVRFFTDGKYYKKLLNLEDKYEYVLSQSVGY